MNIDYKYTILDHVADLAVEVSAAYRAGLVEGSIAALMETLDLTFTETDSQVTTVYTIHFAENSPDNLFVESLNEWLYLVQTRGFRPSRHEIHWTDTHLEIKCFGAINPVLYLSSEIKAVTYHNLVIKAADSSGNRRICWIADL